jgi:LacI family transcriptional regulator
VAILGVDDDPIYCMFSAPRLSSIDPDAISIGRTAASTLESMLADSSAASNPPNILVSPKGVVVRASTDTYPNAPPWFADALAFIRENVSNGISASDVFRHVGFSRTLVERAFRKCLSSSVQKQIAETRIAEAKRLLETTSRPIKEIAALSGFSTLEYLSRAFAAATGVSPTVWRERNVKNA